MLIDILKTDFEYIDERGTLVQLVRRGYSQINVITSKKGIIRGGHYHELNAEAFFVVSGEVVVNAKCNQVEETHLFKKNDFFRIRPGVLHNFYYNEDTILVSLYTLGVELENGSMDMYSE